MHTLRIKSTFIKLRDNYVINQVQSAKLPPFEAAAVFRYSVLFSGRVQKVGFRLEVCELAKRLELTGYCKNLENGDVMAELQGPGNRIKYLISFMQALRRIKIQRVEMKELEVIDGEAQFVKR